MLPALVLSVLLAQSAQNPPSATQQLQPPPPRLEWNAPIVFRNALFVEMGAAAAFAFGGYLLLEPWREAPLPQELLLPASLALVGAVTGSVAAIFFQAMPFGGRGDFWKTLVTAGAVGLLTALCAGATWVGVATGTLPLVIVGGLFTALCFAGIPSVAMGTYEKTHQPGVPR